MIWPSSPSSFGSGGSGGSGGFSSLSSRSRSSSVSGAGIREAKIAARTAASGRPTHQMCSVEMYPWRMDFSRGLGGDGFEGERDFD
jgi:hypothetical protein